MIKFIILVLCALLLEPCLALQNAILLFIMLLCRLDIISYITLYLREGDIMVHLKDFVILHACVCQEYFQVSFMLRFGKKRAEIVRFSEYLLV